MKGSYIKKYISFILLIILFILTGCSLKKTLHQKQLRKEEFLTCNDLKKQLRKEEIKYLSYLNNDNQNLEGISKHFYYIYYLDLFFNKQGCFIPINKLIYEKTKISFIKQFYLKQKVKNFLAENLHLIDNLISENNNQILIIAEGYKEEIEGFTPFSTDEEIWHKYVDIPLKKYIYQLNNTYILNSESLLLNFITQINKNFIEISSKYNFLVKGINPNKTIILKYSPFEYNELEVDKKEENSILNTVHSALEWTPVVGDAMTIIDLFSEKCPSDNKNCQKVLNYIQEELNSWKESRIEDLENNYNYLYSYLYNDLFNRLELPHIKIEIKKQGN